MISDKMTAALNRQINAELYSSYLYLSMSAYAAESGYPGAANWFFIQVKEEMAHAQRTYDYVCSQDAHIELEVIDKPPTQFESLKHVFEETLKHERKVTAMVNDMVGLAQAEKDHGTYNFLLWFVDEQIEEEENVRDLIAQLKLAGDVGPGAMMLDKELRARVFTTPV